MSTPTGDRASLRDLEHTVEEELALAEGGRSEEESFAMPIEEWLIDPIDVQREEIGLRSLLGAVEALEEGA